MFEAKILNSTDSSILPYLHVDIAFYSCHSFGNLSLHNNITL